MLERLFHRRKADEVVEQNNHSTARGNDVEHAARILGSEGVLEAMLDAANRHAKRHPTHGVNIEIKITESVGDEDYKVTPVGVYTWHSPDPVTREIHRRRVSVAVHNAWDGTLRLMHTVQTKLHSDGRRQAEVWQELNETSDQAKRPVIDRLRQAIRSTGETDVDVIQLGDDGERGELETGDK